MLHGRGERQHRLRSLIDTLAYRAGVEAGLFKVFNFSRATLAGRWQAGEAAMRDAAAVRAAPNQEDGMFCVIDG